MQLRTASCVLLLCASVVLAQDYTETRSRLFNLQPSATPTGGSGMVRIQTVPTNPMGSLTIGLHGFYVHHRVWEIGSENVTTGFLALTYSLTDNLEGYFSGSYFAGSHAISPHWTLAETKQGIGSQDLGVKYRFPLKRDGMLQMGGSAGVVLGTAEYKVTGFNFLNTRRNSDVKLRLIESLRFQDRWGVPNLHLNQGYLTQYGSIPDLFIFGFGADYLWKHEVQAILEYEALIEQKTPIYLNENCMALTTALRWYPSSNLSLDVGGIFGVSKERLTDESWRRSDPWQVFLGVTFTPRVNSADLDRDGVPDWLDAELNIYRDTFAQEPDADFDGVPDASDQEPSSPRGSVVNAAGVALDDDGDGVPNGLDRETRTPAGAWVDANGIAYDNDRDGVPDGVDQEPNTLLAALVDERGVSRDGDSDGVPDGLDMELATEPGSAVDAWGRSIQALDPQARYAAAAQRFESSMLRLSDLHCDLGSARIKPEDRNTLDLVGQTLTEFPYLVILIEGHADSTGTEERNRDLSYQRARAVRDYLLDHFSTLTRSNFTVTGLGEMDPIADDGTTDGRIQNRRVEFKVLNRDRLQEMITTWE